MTLTAGKILSALGYHALIAAFTLHYIIVDLNRGRLELQTPVRMSERGGKMFPYEVELERPLPPGDGRTFHLDIVAEGTVLETMVKWQNAHGNEAFSDQLVSISEPATLTMRFSPLINVDQLVYKDGDPKPFEIISIDNVEERGAWTELHVKRQVSAK